MQRHPRHLSMHALVEGVTEPEIHQDGTLENDRQQLAGVMGLAFFYLQRICNHCTYPGWLRAQRRPSIKRPEDGIVLIDQNRCRGYKKCVEQCPYKKPMYRGTTRVSEKCIACYPRSKEKIP